MTRAVLLCVLVASPALSQGRGERQRQCNSEVIGDPGSRYSMRQLPSLRKLHIYGGGVTAVCRGSTMRVRADSAQYNEDSGVLTLIGRARYTDEGSTIESNLMRYFEYESRVEAVGNVRSKGKSGTTHTIDHLNYYRPIPSRNYPVADGVGHSRLVIRDSVNMPDSLATVVESHRLRTERDSLFYAGGNVIITRPDLRATSDSAATNSTRRRVRLVTGKPTMVGRGGRSFTVTGEIIDVFGKEGAMERLFAQGKATAVSDSMQLAADTIDIRTSDGKTMDHIALRGPGRARATSPTRDINANRIDLAMPGQKLRTLNAVGRAYISTKADSAVRTSERDWIEGDSVVATFDSLARADSAKQPPLRTLLARGSARSFYHVAQREYRDSLPAINYVTGDRIDVQFADGTVRDVTVTGDVRGITIEPIRTDTAGAARRPPAGRGGR